MNIAEPLADAGRIFVDHDAYTDEARFHSVCRRLRRESPIHRVEAPGIRPFWAITRHADVMEVESHADVFTNGPAPMLETAETEARLARQGQRMRSLIHMDGPEHRAARSIVADWFLPGAVRRLDDRLAQLGRHYVGQLAAMDGRCEFVADVAAHYPLHVVFSLLGLPEDDFDHVLRLTQQFFGSSDPELQRGRGHEYYDSVLSDFVAYFRVVTEDRRRSPRDDLATVIAHAEIDGQPLDPVAVVGHFITIATAGHDTTSSAIAGGLEALIGHPEQWQRLVEDPGLLPTAIEEIIRWVSPVKHFMRTATMPYTLRGQPLQPGDWLLLSFPSANRDEEGFSDPFTFDVGRSPNRHVGFGFGPHHCLGAHLARLEMRALFAALLDAVDHVELAGEPQWTRTIFVGGPKHLPIRYRLR